MFTEALAGLQNGESARRMDLGGTGDRTVWVRRLVEVNREFMKRAATMVLMREKWHGQLIASLEIRHATLPVTQDQH